MLILALKPGHDGVAALLDDGRLVFSLEAEKDSFPRYAPLSPTTVLGALELCPRVPDVVALGGWHKGLPGLFSGIGAGYFGQDGYTLQDGTIFGHPTSVFSSTHERSHLFMVAAMAPDAPLKECVIVLWEGVLGAVYHWIDHGRQIRRRHVLSEPGCRFGALFALAEPSFPDHDQDPNESFAGKLMALAAFGRDDEVRPEERATVERLLEIESAYPFDKYVFRDSALYNCGVEDPRLKRAAAYLQDRLFGLFFAAVRETVPAGLPLLVVGGCGLNCEWNRRWLDSNYFESVFVPPCPNDSGSAIGTAVDAFVQHGGPCAIQWDVFSGAPWLADAEAGPEWHSAAFRPDELAKKLAADVVVAWVQGRCEIGPRALGHRSLLASPLRSGNRDRLNTIKSREGYRPIAPCCLSDELNRWFDPPIDDPYMLYFSDVRTDELPAVTHVDGTARVQSVDERGDPRLRELLTAFRSETGFGVLCNTSLNFQGHGFINRASELFAYCALHGVDDVVIGDVSYTRVNTA